MRQRIFTASQAGDLKQVRSLQKLMLRSRANTLLSVRGGVTQRNAGRLTAGVGEQVIVTARDKARLVAWVHNQSQTWKALPFRRVFIPKAGGKKHRALGIPVIVDRVLQARVVNALEPEWEARFEPRSYGFRPSRGCQDAIGAIYRTLKGANPRRRWVLDADLAGAFDRIDHTHLLAMLGTFPARGMIAQWLRAGVVDQGCFAPTEEGTPPRGGVVSSLLLNIALHGMEQAQESATATPAPTASKRGRARWCWSDTPMTSSRCVTAMNTRCRSGKCLPCGWPRGLALNEDKTTVVSVDEGFDFFGFNVRRYNDKLLIKPSNAGVRRLRLGRLLPDGGVQ